MESDFSLIQIAGEDDSLLQQSPTLNDATAAASSTNYCFSCSPLQIPGSNRNSHRSRFSPIVGLKDNADVEKPSCSSPIGSSNKENIHVKKSEVPKLSVETQQMNRRKRTGAYNLRKSLAWDRAFFTEEGVLNSLELSMLSGSFGNSSGEVLPTIHEEGRKLPGNSGSTGDSAVLQGMPKMLSNQRGNRTGSKSGGCPHPLLSSSLKRPANASTPKSAMKESKIPKIPASTSGAYSLPTPASRSGVHSLPKSNKNNVPSTSHSKHNQIGQTDIVQKSAGLQSSYKNTRSSSNKAKAGSDSSSLSAKSSLQYPRRNMAKSALEVRSSTNPQLPLVTKANCGLEVFPAAVLPPTGSRAPDAHDVSRKTGALPKNTHCIGGNMRDKQFQTTKPSGLRMPSPSLGFFCQPKSSASNRSSQKATQPSNIAKSYIPGLQRLNVSNYTHDPRLLHAPEKMPKMDNNASVSGNARVSGSSTECSLPSARSDASHENMKLKLDGTNVLTMEVMRPCYPKSSELMKENQEVHKIVGCDKGFQECGEPHKVDQSSSKDDSDTQMYDNNWLLQSRSSDQLKKYGNNEVTIACPDFIFSKMNELENSNSASQHSCAVLVNGIPGANDTIKHQLVEKKQCSSSVGTREVISGYQFEYAAGDIKQAFGIMHNDSSNDIHVDEWSSLKAELINASAGKADQIPHGENSNLTRNNGILLEDRKLFESQKYKRENIANVNSNICESNGSERLSSNSPPHESAEQANGAAGVDQLSDKLRVEDGQVHFLDETLLLKNCDDKLHTSEVHDQYLVVDDDNKKSGEHPKLQSCRLLVEQASELNHDFLLDDSSLLLESTPAEESREEYGLEVALNIIQEKGEDCESKLNCSNVIITRDPSAIQDSGADVHEMVEQPPVLAALSSSAEIDPSVENRNTYVDTEFKPNLSLNKIRDHTAGAATTCNSMAFSSSSKEGVIGVNGLKIYIFTEKAETEVSSGNPHEENERIKMNGGILFGESRSDNEFHTGDLMNTADVGLIHQGSTGSELKSCHTAFLFEDTEQVNERAAGQDKMTDELCVGDTKVQSLDGNLLVGSSNGSLSNSAMDSRCLMVVTDVNGQSGKQPELKTPGLVVDHIFQDNPGLHLNDYLLLGKGTSSEEPHEEKVLANVPVVQEQSDVDGSESKSSCVVIQVPLSMQDSGADVEGMVEHQLLEDKPSGSADIGTSIEHDKYSIDIHFRNDMVFSGEATSSKSGSAYKAFCSSEESDLYVKRIQTLANETNVMDIGVDKINGILSDDIEVKISQKNVSAGELQHKLDDVICLTEDEDTTMSIKRSEDDGKQNNLMINPPLNVVPFSDEWLAAMEAAGEEILTMKSGAVQNSPPDKSPPEPGPWSPVKRKHNSIGPFDCTKFVNIPPPNSD